MKRITDISEAFLPDAVNWAKKNLYPEQEQQEQQEQEAPTSLEFDKPDWDGELREVQDKFYRHNQPLQIGTYDPKTGKTSATQAKMGVIVTRKRKEQFFAIRVKTTYDVFRLELSKNGYEIFKAPNIVFPFFNVKKIKEAVADIENYTGWKIYGTKLDIIIGEELKEPDGIDITR